MNCFTSSLPVNCQKSLLCSRRMAMVKKGQAGVFDRRDLGKSVIDFRIGREFEVVPIAQLARSNQCGP